MKKIIMGLIRKRPNKYDHDWFRLKEDFKYLTQCAKCGKIKNRREKDKTACAVVSR